MTYTNNVAEYLLEAGAANEEINHSLFLLHI